MRRIILPKIQGFYLTIILKDDLLILKMEEDSSEMTFSITLDNNSISQMTYGLFQDKEQLAKGLEDAASQPDSGLTLSLLSPGQLTYTVHFPEGIPEESFTIYLLQQVSEPEEVRKSKERLEKLESMMGQMEQKMIQMTTTFENSCKVLRHQSAPNFYFSNRSIDDTNYSFFDDYQTATLKVEGNLWIEPLEILPPVPLGGQHSYSIIINEIKEAIYSGITATEKNGQGQSQHDVVYKYCTKNGWISGKARRKAQGKGPYGDAGSMIKMCVDTEKGSLTFFVNNRAVNSCEILKGYQYFAHIYLMSMGDSITLC